MTKNEEKIIDFITIGRIMRHLSHEEHLKVKRLDDKIFIDRSFCLVTNYKERFETINCSIVDSFEGGSQQVIADSCMKFILIIKNDKNTQVINQNT